MKEKVFVTKLNYFECDRSVILKPLDEIKTHLILSNSIFVYFVYKVLSLIEFYIQNRKRTSEAE